MPSGWIAGSTVAAVNVIEENVPSSRTVPFASGCPDVVDTVLADTTSDASPLTREIDVPSANTSAEPSDCRCRTGSVCGAPNASV